PAGLPGVAALVGQHLAGAGPGHPPGGTPRLQVAEPSAGDADGAVARGGLVGLLAGRLLGGVPADGDGGGAPGEAGAPPPGGRPPGGGGRAAVGVAAVGGVDADDAPVPLAAGGGVDAETGRTQSPDTGGGQEVEHGATRSRGPPAVAPASRRWAPRTHCSAA